MASPRDVPQVVRVILVVIVVIARLVAVLLLVVVVNDVLPGGGADGPLRSAAVVRDAFSAVLRGDEPRAARIVPGQGGAPVGIPAHAGLLPILLLVAFFAQRVQVVSGSKSL